MERKTSSLKKTARIAGLLSLIMGIPAPFSLLYIPSKIIVSGDAAATVTNLLANESLFRAGIVGHIFSATMFLAMVLVLYKLLRGVSEFWAQFMVVLVVAQIPMVLLVEALNFSALMVVKGEILKTFELTQSQDLTMLLLRMNRYGITVLQIFWGLWLLPYGILVYKSGFIPRILGVLLIINGIGYLVESHTFLLMERSDYLLVRKFTFVTYFGELFMMLWLLIKGVRDTPAANYELHHMD